MFFLNNKIAGVGQVGSSACRSQSSSEKRNRYDHLTIGHFLSVVVQSRKKLLMG